MCRLGDGRDIYPTWNSIPFLTKVHFFSGWYVERSRHTHTHTMREKERMGARSSVRLTPMSMRQVCIEYGSVYHYYDLLRSWIGARVWIFFVGLLHDHLWCWLYAGLLEYAKVHARSLSLSLSFSLVLSTDALYNRDAVTWSTIHDFTSTSRPCVTRSLVS